MLDVVEANVELAPTAPLGGGHADVDPGFEPQTEDDLAMCLRSWRWRIFSGRLYKIVAKTNADGQPSLVVAFKPNAAQRILLDQLHGRDIILKARQLGCTTLIAVLWLDHALFNADQRCAIIAHTEDDAKVIFRDKVRYAYDNLPAALRAAMPLSRDSASELLFRHNNSSVRVSVSVRSGTVNMLHVSEFGKIAAKFPAKATEITTGSFPAVPTDGVIVVESTAEGLGGAFHAMSTAAEKRAQIARALGPLEWAFHFLAWWLDPTYELDPYDTIIPPSVHLYFDRLEDLLDREFSLRKRAWYAAKLSTDFVADPDLMFREYPSTSAEAWRASTEGKYLAHVLASARRQGRIGKYPMLKHIPVNSFWDLGASDDTVIWLHQRIEGRDRWCGYREASGEGYLPFILWLESLECVFGSHYLPHDAHQTRQTEVTITSPLRMLREMRPSWTWVVVPRVQNIQHGIDLLRTDFVSYEFDEVACADGLGHLEAYSREWNERLQTWADYPRHDKHSHAADAIRQKAQGYRPGNPNARPQKPRDRSGMTA